MISIREIRDRYTPEMALAILICRVYFNTATSTEINDYVTSNRIDWNLFEQIITTHQVRPLIYKVLSANNACIDHIFIETLRKKCFRIATQNLHKLEELVHVNKLFKKYGIKSVPYKGVILGQALFGDFVSRETVDIDFLMDEVYFSIARKILVEEGYTTRYYNPDFEKQFLRTSHELQFSKVTSKGEIKIEIHWAVTNNMMNIPLPNADILCDLQTISLLGEDIDILNLENHLLVLLVHHGVNDIWRILKHTIDIGIFLEKYDSATDWNTFRDATIKYKIRHTTEIGFLIAHKLFGIAIPASYLTKATDHGKIIDNLLSFPSIKKRKLNLENLEQQLFLRDSFTDKLRMLLSYIRTGITPNVRDMEAFPVAKKWYILYYLIKPYRILFRR